MALRALVSMLLVASTASLALAPTQWRARRRLASQKEKATITGALDLQRNLLDYERERFKRTPVGWWDDVVSNPSPFALSQIFGAAEDLRAPCADRVLLQLPSAAEANRVVTDALSSGLSYTMVSVPSDTRVYVKGARQELQNFVDGVGDEATVTWGSGPTI